MNDINNQKKKKDEEFAKVYFKPDSSTGSIGKKSVPVLDQVPSEVYL